MFSGRGKKDQLIDQCINTDRSGRKAQENQCVSKIFCKHVHD